MKSEGRRTGSYVSESRKIRKPLMEKKRRARINDSLETLKQILLDSKTALKGSKGGQKTTAKLEKADILEMTVHYLQFLHSKLRLHQTSNCTQEILAKTKKEVLIRPADSSSDSTSTIQIGIQLIPRKLEDGSMVFVVPPRASAAEGLERNTVEMAGNVWRPW